MESGEIFQLCAIEWELTIKQNEWDYLEHVVVHKFSFEVQQKPAITEIEMSIIPILLHQRKYLVVKNLWIVKAKIFQGHYVLDISSEWDNSGSVIRFTCIRERIFAKCWSIAPPWGKLAAILFIISQKHE